MLCAVHQTCLRCRHSMQTLGQHAATHHDKAGMFSQSTTSNRLRMVIEANVSLQQDQNQHACVSSFPAGAAKGDGRGCGAGDSASGDTRGSGDGFGWRPVASAVASTSANSLVRETAVGVWGFM